MPGMSRAAPLPGTGGRTRAAVREERRDFVAATGEGTPSSPRLDIYEPGSLGPFRKYLRRLPNYVESQYSPDIAGGSVRDRVRYEDLMHLSFPDASLDLVITSDVFEHVRKPHVAFAELHRVLRPGGAHVFTVPLRHPMPAHTVPRVDTSGDEDIHLLEPRYSQRDAPRVQQLRR